VQRHHDNLRERRHGGAAGHRGSQCDLDGGVFAQQHRGTHVAASRERGAARFGDAVVSVLGAVPLRVASRPPPPSPLAAALLTAY